MFEPIRGGTRGGQAEFKWSDVSADKDREHYLGHSINAPTGRWQKNKDVHWYSRDMKDGESERQAEIRRIKEAEEEALSIALGFAPSKRAEDGENAGEKASGSGNPGPDEDLEKRRKEKEEKKLRKLEKKAKKAERKARKEAARAERAYESDSDEDRLRRDEHRSRPRSRSASPRRRHFSAERHDRQYSRRSPRPSYTRDRSGSPPPPRKDDRRWHDEHDYRTMGRERERERRR